MDFKRFIDTRRSGGPDTVLFMAVFILTFIGIAMVFSSSAIKALNTYGDQFHFLKRQSLWVAVSLIAVIIVQAVDYRSYFRFTGLMVLIAFLSLILLYVPGLGHAAKGSVRWFNLGFLSVQPSEFVKLFMLIYLAKVFSKPDDPTRNPALRLVIPLVILGAVFLLVMLQPDFGTAVTMLAVAIAVLFVSGFPVLYLAIMAVISVPAFYLLIYQVSYRWQRIIAFLDPWGNRYDVGYHITQAFIAFKKGGFFGQGLGHGTQKLGRLPEPQTDFIFAVLGEEAGVVGALVVIILFCVILWRGMRIALDATDDFGRLLAIALTLAIVIQGMLNISVVTGTLPTTGIPLPFISYGGSSLLTNMIAAGILLNISRYREVVHAPSRTPEEFE